MTYQRISSGALALIALLACADHPIPAAPPGLEVSVAASEVTLGSAALDDAIARIIPSLANEATGPQLARAFDELSAALYSDHPSIGGKLSSALAALENYENAGGEAADLTALTMALESVTLRVGSNR